MRRRIFLLLLACMPLAAAAADSPLGMSYVQTNDLRLIYFDSLSYLQPHTVRTFANSLAWQRRMFGWVPSESTSVLLKDFSDSNAVELVNTYSRSVPPHFVVADTPRDLPGRHQ